MYTHTHTQTHPHTNTRTHTHTRVHTHKHTRSTSGVRLSESVRRHGGSHSHYVFVIHVEHSLVADVRTATRLSRVRYRLLCKRCYVIVVGGGIDDDDDDDDFI